MGERLDIDLERLKELTDKRIPAKEIASELGCSLATLKRRKKEFNIYSFSKLPQEDLEEVVAEMKNKQMMANWGLRMTKGYLAAEGIQVGEGRVLQALRTVDPEGIAQRSKRPIRRRQYINEISNLVSITVHNTALFQYFIFLTFHFFDWLGLKLGHNCVYDWCFPYF
jgi:hypothetical protein